MYCENYGHTKHLFGCPCGLGCTNQWCQVWINNGDCSVTICKCNVYLIYKVYQLYLIYQDLGPLVCAS